LVAVGGRTQAGNADLAVAIQNGLLVIDGGWITVVAADYRAWAVVAIKWGAGAGEADGFGTRYYCFLIVNRAVITVITRTGGGGVVITIRWRAQAGETDRPVAVQNGLYVTGGGRVTVVTGYYLGWSVTTFYGDSGTG
jgi:hypothetical protein